MRFREILRFRRATTGSVPLEVLKSLQLSMPENVLEAIFSRSWEARLSLACLAFIILLGPRKMSVIRQNPTDSAGPFLALPEWTEYRKKRGLDPLGMQSSSVATYQRLVPGISNVTLRIRYYGLYAWLCWRYAHEVGDTNPQTWQRFVRRAEALYALIAVHRSGETGVAGIQWATKALGNTNGKIDFAAASEPGIENGYLKQAWGAYGAAYASQLYEIGIFAQVQGHQIPVPSSTVGKALAEAFAQALGPSGEHFFRIHRNGRASRSDLDQLMVLAPSEIRDGSSECECYRRLLFARLDQQRPNDHERRRTLLLLLRVTDQLGRLPRAEDIRWMLYRDPDGVGSPLVLASAELHTHRMRWRIYQANDLLHIVYEALMKYLLDLLEAYPSGIALASLIDEAIDNIRSVTESWPQTWRQHLDENAVDTPSVEEELTETLMREARLEGVCTALGAWHAITLLAVVYKRTQNFRQHIQNELGYLNPALSHSLVSELGFLDSVSEESFDRILQQIFERRIIKQHLWVALRKLRYQGDYTFLVESDEGRIRLRTKDGPVFTNPRLAPSVTFLRDTYLIDEQGLTQNGKNILAES
jgi:hypothetical protein